MNNGHRYYFNVHERLIVSVDPRVLDILNNVHPLEDSPENSVLIIQPLRWDRGDEELGGVRVLICYCE